MFKAITSKPLWVNIVAAIVLMLLIVFIFFFSLDWITHHNKNEKVPVVTGQNIVAATKILESRGFDVEIIDSVFIDTTAKGAVIKQSPEGDAFVKAGRTVYLTINRTVPPLVEMPSLVGFSIRSAEMYLQSLGLKLGDTTFKPDIAKNAVLEQYFNGFEIKAGTKIPMGSTISFVLGSGLGTSDIEVPDLFGMTLLQAKAHLNLLGLGISAVIPQGPFADSSKVYVEKQTPGLYTEPVAGQKIRNKIKQGQLIDIYITSNTPTRDTSNNIQ